MFEVGREINFKRCKRIVGFLIRRETVEPESLERLIFERCGRFDLGGTPVRAELCGTLREAVEAPYFYEYFFMMGQEKIPFGRRYKRWRREMNKKMLEGKELYYLGNPERFKMQEERKRGIG